LNLFRSRFEYFLTRWAALFIEALPAEIAWLIGRTIGWLTYVFDIRHRRVGARNLKRVYPELTLGQIRQHLRRVYGHLGKVMVEMIRTPRTFRQCRDRPIRNGSTLRINRYLTLLNPDRVERVCRNGRGVIFVTAHLGNWELTGMAMALLGLPLYSVARTMDNPLLDRYITRLRTVRGQKILNKHGSIREALSLLGSAQRLGIIVDQNAPVDNVFVDFLGEKAAVARGVASLAVKTGCAILPGFSYRVNESGRHVVVAGDPIEVPQEGGREDKIMQMTRDYTAVIEGWIREHPEQWLWIHNRWKTRPPKEVSGEREARV
jgi:KDO2-lipid IV(A) lauroyltransferase